MMDKKTLAKKWLWVEGLVLCLPAVALIVEGLPFAGYALLEIFSGETDGATLMACVMQLVPYVCAVFALMVVWQLLLRVASGRRLGLGMSSVIAAAATIVACFATESVASAGLRLLVSLPVWLLAVHVCLLGTPQQAQSGPQLE